MLIPPQVPTGDNTILSLHDRCPRLYQLSGLKGHRSKGVSAAIQFGSLLHVGLETFYKVGTMEAAIKAMFDYQDFHEVPEEYRTKGRAYVTIQEYIDFWQGDRQWWGDRVIFTETPFTLTDPEGFRYGGRIDLIVEYHGEPWIVDHKSTSRGGDGWWSEYQLSPQMAGYVWAGTQLHGEPIRGVIINRLLIHKAKKPPHEQFARRAFFYTPQIVKEWRESKIHQYHEIARQMDTGYFPPRMRSCKERYGLCGFFDVCSLENEVERAKMLERRYKIEKWDWMKQHGELATDGGDE